MKHLSGHANEESSARLEEMLHFSADANDALVVRLRFYGTRFMTVTSWL